jgi:hypothetical protein
MNWLCEGSFRISSEEKIIVGERVRLGRLPAFPGLCKSAIPSALANPSPLKANYNEQQNITKYQRI